MSHSKACGLPSGRPSILDRNEILPATTDRYFWLLYILYVPVLLLISVLLSLRSLLRPFCHSFCLHFGGGRRATTDVRHRCDVCLSVAKINTHYHHVCVTSQSAFVMRVCLFAIPHCTSLIDRD